MRRILAISSAALLVAMMIAAGAFAAEVSRDEYTAAVEPICKSNTQANERILSGVRQEVKSGDLKSAAAKFTKAGSALKKTLGQIEKVAAPSADEARLSQWFDLVKLESEYFAMAGKKLKSGDKGGAQHFVTKLTQNANKANNAVLPFGFHYCRLEPSKFT